MAAQDRFSLHRYSLGSAGNQIFVEQTFIGTMGGLAGAAVPINAAAHFADSLQMVARGATALLSQFHEDDSLKGSAAARADIQASIVFADALGQSAYAVKDIGQEMSTSGTLRGRAAAGKNIRCEWSAGAVLSAHSYGSKEIGMETQFFSALGALSSAMHEETESLSISIAIPPGAELWIDSDAFSVMMNGENILYAQLGDWINISRDLLRLDIESGSGGNLSGSLIYTERYL